MKSLTNSPKFWLTALSRLSALGNAIIGQGKKKTGFRADRTFGMRYIPKRNISFFQL